MEKRRAAIGAGIEELEFTWTVNAVVGWHGAAEFTHDGAGPEMNVPSGSQTPKVGCLRQPPITVMPINVRTFALTYVDRIDNLLLERSAMRFEWDEHKNRQNLRKHDVRFETAVLVFVTLML